MSTETRRSSKMRQAMPTLLVALLIPACGASSPDDSDSITIGLLLPFTGTSSATASNFERSVLHARDHINQGGGIHGRMVRVVARDTHSRLEDSLRSTQELIDSGAVAVLGPESAEIAEGLLSPLAENEVALLSPLVGAAGDPDIACEDPWIRLAPSAEAFGEALAKLVASAGIERTALLHSESAYDAALTDAARQRLGTLGVEVTFEATLESGAQSYASALQGAASSGAEAAVLATPPRTAALVLNESSTITELRWFLSPRLKTAVFVQNVDPVASQGALGVAPKIFEDGLDFPESFTERWEGDVPLEGAYFYYDAMALLALALQHSEFTRGRPDYLSLTRSILDVAAAPGEAVAWDELGKGLNLLQDGQQAYYAGLTGPMLLDPCGKRRLGVTGTWRVENGEITEADEQ